jgi:hypothetical protein
MLTLSLFSFPLSFSFERKYDWRLVSGNHVALEPGDSELVSGVCFLPQTPLPSREWARNNFLSTSGEHSFMDFNVDRLLQLQVVRLVSSISSATDPEFPIELPDEIFFRTPVLY